MLKKLFKKKAKKTIIEPVVNDKELSFPSLVDNALNDGIQFEEDYFIMQSGLGSVTYGRSFYIKPSGYPRTVRIGWLDGFFSGEDMDCSIHIDPYHRTDAIRKLKDKIDELEAVYDSAVKNENRALAEETLQKLHDCENLRNQIRNNQNGLYYVTVCATIYAESLNELNNKCVSVEKNLAGESIELLNCYNSQREGWLSTLPLGRNYIKKSARNLDQLALTATFPHSSSKLNHTDGMPIGVYGQEYVYYNNFDSKLNNYNVGIFGESGAGKGVFVKQLIGRGYMDGIEKVVVIDVEPEYLGLTEALGGVVIEVRSADSLKEETSSRINPLDIYVEKEIKNRNMLDEYVIERVNINEKVKEGIEFFKVMKESVSPKDSSELTAIELGELDEILQKLYRKRNITDDPESIYEQVETVDEHGNIVFQRKYIDMPTISEVKSEIEKRIADGKEHLEELKNVVGLFTRGRAFGMFDGQTIIKNEYGVDLDDAPIVTFDISSLSQNGIERPLAQHVLMTWIWNRFIKNNPKPKKRVVQDEAWMTLEFPSMVAFWQFLSARGRKWNVSLTLVSQRYEKFHRSKEAQDIISQLNTVAFLKQPDQDIPPILEVFRFSEEVGQMIRTAEVGDVIFKAGKEIVAFRSEPTPEEWRYLNTNQNIDVKKLVAEG